MMLSIKVAFSASTHLTAHPDTCLLGDSRAHKVDSQYERTITERFLALRQGLCNLVWPEIYDVVHPDLPSWQRLHLSLLSARIAGHARL